MGDIHADIVHLIRFVAESRAADAAAVGKRLLRQLAKERPDLAAEARSALSLLTSDVLRRAPQPREVAPLPVDADSRMELVRRVVPTDLRAHWPESVHVSLDAVVRERERAADLSAAGLVPSRSMLFVGPPGVGKTRAAHEVASRLGRDLLVLDLAAVMSSFLGKTGSNIRAVLDYAAQSGDVLLLDEFDAIAKRRDDSADVGELRRLVNVLLQSIDDWPPESLLIAATNHPELLDPAVWRRFDSVVEFPKPQAADVRRVLVDVIGEDVPAETLDIASTVLAHSSFAEVERETTRARRAAVLNGEPIGVVLFTGLSARIRSMELTDRLSIAEELSGRGFSQRRVHDITGVSRDTLRKHARGDARNSGS